MTIIAAKLTEGIAADRLIQWDSGPSFHTCKIHRLANGGFVGIAGDLESGLRFVAWREECLRTAKSRKNPPETPSIPDDEDFDALEIQPGRLFLWGRRFVPIGLTDHCYAIGAGADIAVHAMRRGGSPAKAVDAAIKFMRQGSTESDWYQIVP